MIQFSREGTIIYFTAGDKAKIKIWALPIPPTPDRSTTDPYLPAKYTTPIELTHDRAASAIQVLITGDLLFTQSSFASPNDVFVIPELKRFETEVLQSNDLEYKSFAGEIRQITRFTENALKDKHLGKGEEFWFKGANDHDVQGWILKPGGWKDDDTKKWPILLLIHGGALLVCSPLFQPLMSS